MLNNLTDTEEGDGGAQSQGEWWDVSSKSPVCRERAGIGTATRENHRAVRLPTHTGRTRRRGSWNAS